MVVGVVVVMCVFNILNMSKDLSQDEMFNKYKKML